MRLKFIFILCLTIYTNCIFSQSPCPKGKTNCQGECGRYIDEDSDGNCDLVAQVEIKDEKDKVKDEKDKVKEKDTAPSIDITSNAISLESEEILSETITLEVENDDEIVALSTNKTKSTQITQEEEKSQTPKPYRLITITLITLITYLSTFLMVKFNWIKRTLHRKIWNTLLLICFLLSCVLGLILVIQLNYNVLKDIYLLNLKLHVEFGIAMALIAIIHIFWHIKYFKRIIIPSKDK